MSLHIGININTRIPVIYPEHYPEAEMITLVMDNLSTHKKAALYEVFAPEEAKRIADNRDPLYPQARQLAQYGRDWSQHPIPTVPRSTNPYQPTTGKTRPCLAKSSSI